MSGGWIGSWAVMVWTVALLLSGCESPGNPDLLVLEAPPSGFQPTPGAPFEPPPGPDPEPPAGPIGVDQVSSMQPDVLVLVNGEAIKKADLAEYICLRDPARARLMIDKLIKFRILRSEMKRLKVEVPEEKVQERVKADLKKVLDAARARGQDPDLFVKDRLGIPMATYRYLESILVRTAMARARVVRYAQLLEDRVEGRIIVVQTREEADRVLEKLEAGADFGALARKVSHHQTHVNGGLLPPHGRWNVEPELEKVLFSLPRGGISEVIKTEEEGKTSFVILKCVRFHRARRVSYAEVKEEIEEGLRLRPLEEIEGSGWIQSMVKRYKVELFLRPPEELRYIGEKIR